MAEPSGKENYFFCIDFRYLNYATEPIHWPIPIISNMLQRLGSCKLSHSFHHVRHHLNVPSGRKLAVVILDYFPFVLVREASSGFFMICVYHEIHKKVDVVAFLTLVFYNHRYRRKYTYKVFGSRGVDFYLDFGVSKRNLLRYLHH